MIDSVNSRVPSYVTAFIKRLKFLKGNYRLLLAWPIMALVIAAIGWGALLAKLDRDRQEIEDAALKQAAALSRSYADRLSRIMEEVDQTLLHVKFEWDLSSEQLRLEQIQQRGLFPPSSHFYVAIFDRDGRLLTSTIPTTQKVTIDDRPYFLVHKNSPADSMYIDRPSIGRITDRNVVHFSRRLTDHNGVFNGVVVVSAAPDYFVSNYDDVTLGKHGFLGVVGQDNIVRAMRTGEHAYPPEPEARASFPRFPLESGSLLLNGNTTFADQRSRYVGWRTVAEYPLIALTGLDQQDTLAPYWAERAASIRYATSATAALGAFALIAMALSMRLAWRKYRMKLLQATYRMATEEGNEGFYIARSIQDRRGEIIDFEIADCNQPGAEFFHLRREQLIGKRLSTLYDGNSRDRLMGRLLQAIEVGSYESDLEVHGDGPVTAQWVHLKIVRSDGDLAVRLRDISDTKAHVKELERRGNEDALTGLPNRHWLQTYLPRAIDHAGSEQMMLALLFVDLDGFKTVNDTMGHAAGDELLKNAARRLQVAIRPDDKVVRIGGDEFVVIIERIAHKIDAAHVAERILHAFEDTFRLSQGVHSVGTSIGISTFPSDGTDADTLLKNADIAMYSVKTGGKGSYSFYDQKFYEALRARLEKEIELRHAIDNDEFVMYYQPRVEMSSGITSSMEALVRWVHPTKGLLGPLEFIPLAEDTGLILDLGELIIEKVCAQLARWASRGRDLVPVSINVSPRQFNHGDIAKTLAACIAHHKIDPHLIEIEITESSMMGENVSVSKTLATIQEMGIKLLVDDFGTGYSSLSQLQKLDFDVLKVDRAFTVEIDRTEQGNVFFTAIITMAHALGMRVVAEGVENERQIAILRSLRCDEIQGFYISKPLPSSETQPILPRKYFASTA